MGGMGIKKVSKKSGRPRAPRTKELLEKAVYIRFLPSSFIKLEKEAEKEHMPLALMLRRVVLEWLSKK
jgi:hypothetical protein